MLQRPDDVVGGLALAARAVGAREAVVFLKGSFDGPARALESALGRVSLDGLSVERPPGRRRLRHGRGDGGPRDARGPQAVAAAQAAAAGRRRLPGTTHPRAERRDARPGGPAPRATPRRFRAGETTLVTLWGDVRQPGRPRGAARHAAPAVIERARRRRDRRRSASSSPAGPAGGAAPRRPSSTRPSIPRRSARRARLSAREPSWWSARRPARSRWRVSVAGFFERENCGQCPPCTVGTASLARDPARARGGTARAPRPARPPDVAGFMSGHGYCAHCRTAAAVATGMARGSRTTVRAHVGAAAARGRAPAPRPLRPRLAGALRGRAGRPGAAAMRSP